MRMYRETALASFQSLKPWLNSLKGNPVIGWVRYFITNIMNFYVCVVRNSFIFYIFLDNKDLNKVLH